MHICFLDIDGTLVLTGGAGQTAFAQTLAADFGIPEIDAEVSFAGRSDRAIAMDLFRSHGVEPSAENWRRFCAGYVTRLEKTLVTHQGSVLPGVPDFLTALAARGDVAIGLLTGNVREGPAASSAIRSVGLVPVRRLRRRACRALRHRRCCVSGRQTASQRSLGRRGSMERCS